VTLKPGYNASSELENKIRTLILKHMGKPFVPKDIIFVPDLPRNRAGKIMRRMIRAVVVGEKPGDITILENPEILDEIRSAR
jgi:acetyl-CoA synthetase